MITSSSIVTPPDLSQSHTQSGAGAVEAALEVVVAVPAALALGVEVAL